MVPHRLHGRRQNSNGMRQDRTSVAVLHAACADGFVRSCLASRSSRSSLSFVVTFPGARRKTLSDLAAQVLERHDVPAAVTLPHDWRAHSLAPCLKGQSV